MTAIIVASVLILVGAAVFVGALASADFDFTKLVGNKYETRTEVIDGSFRSIKIDTDTADIKFIPTKDGSCKAEITDSTKCRHTVTVADGTLTVKLHDECKWYDHIGFNLGTQKITLYIPEGSYETLTVDTSTGDTDISAGFTFGKVKIKASTGNAALDGTTAASLEIALSTGKITVTDTTVNADADIRVSTGKVYLADFTCDNLTTSGDTGELTMENVKISNRFDAVRDTGDILFENLDAGTVTVRTSTGDVKGSLAKEMRFNAKASTGKVDVPLIASDSENIITTNTGDIKISYIK